MSLVEKALALAAAGFAVFPLSPGSKVPLEGSTGFYEATRDEAQIRAWWAREPNANIGLYPGQDFVIIDIDPKNGGDIADLELKHGILPATLEVETPSGGRHYYYHASQPLPSTNGKLLKGVDTRGLNGYVVAPGSIVDDKEYVANCGELLDGAFMAAAPEWFYTTITGSIERHPDAGKIIDGLEWDEPVNVERARQWLHNDARHGDASRGNGSAFKTAAVVRDHGVSFGKCVGLMHEWNDALDWKWDDDVLVTKIENAYLYAKRPAGAERTASKGSLDLMRERAAADATKGAPEQAQPARKRFQLLTVADLPSGPPDWLVENAIVRRSTIEIYGPYGSYKSFLALDLALHVSAGLTWAGHKIPKAQPVLYVAGEGAFGVGARVRAWLEAHKHDGANFRIVPVMPFFGEADDLRDFTETLGDFRPALTFFDTFSRAMAGLDENSAKDTSLFFARADELGRALNTAVGIVHHTGKDVSKGSRGNVNIPASCDTVFEVESPRPGHATLTMKKQKDWSQWEEPKGFAAKEVGDSLVMLPAKIQPSKEEAQQGLQFQAMANVLQRSKEAIATTTLAYEMAHELNQFATPAEKDQLTDRYRKWLGRAASNPAYAMYVFYKGKGGNDSTLWKTPTAKSGVDNSDDGE